MFEKRHMAQNEAYQKPNTMREGVEIIPTSLSSAQLTCCGTWQLSTS